MNIGIKKENTLSEYSAHIRVNSVGFKMSQTCTEHSRSAAQYAGEALRGSHLQNTAYLAGLIHDMGKYKCSFQNYLEHQVNGETLSRGSVIHTFAGVKYILNRYHKEEKRPYQNMTSELLAYAVGAHHGLFDCVDEQHQNGFVHRLEVRPEGDEEAVQNFLNQCVNEDDIDVLFDRACEEVSSIIENCMRLDFEDSELGFCIGLLSRLVTSAVMEGDRRDTAEFMNDIAFAPDPDRKLWEKLLIRIESKLQNLDSEMSINRARRQISNQCRQAAENSSGIYRLNVPTGGGKTLSSLRYALAHAKKWGKKRIIFVSPLLSILEQNSKVIRSYIEDDSIILEHHSNVVLERDTKEWEQHELFAENWSAPIIITTLVQLLNAMFDGKTSSVRRFHALSDAVIVIDEVQTVPSKLLTMFNITVSFLAEISHTTIVLCSATQPCLETVAHPIRVTVRDVIPYDYKLWEIFRRTNICNAGTHQINDVPYLAEQILETTDSLLIVCNKKSQSEMIFKALQDKGYDIFHLSAAMCMAHRQVELDGIYKSLENREGAKTVCVATQVIEAGVDISFGAVIRLSAGMDSVIQAAGRCNRNGESDELGRVYIARVKDEELSHLPEIELSKQATEQLVNAFQSLPERFAYDLASNESIRYYYQRLYSNQRMLDPICHDFPIKNKPSIFSMLSWNDTWVLENTPSEKYYLRQAFALAGKAFSVFDSDTTDVIVPFEDGERIITELLSERAKYDIGYVKLLVEKAKRYTVSLYDYQRKKLEEYHALIPLANGLMLGLDPNYYNCQTGVSIKSNQEETNVCNILIL